MKKIVLFFIILFSLNSCCNDDSETIIVDTIGKNNLYGGGEEGISKSNLVINDSENWNNLITKMNSRSNVSNSFTETDIDFTKYQIIAVFDEVKYSGGYSIDIIDITENNGTVVIKIENLKKGDATSVITQPFHIIKIKKTNKEIVFE